MTKTVTFQDGTVHTFEDIQYTYDDNAPHPAVRERYLFQGQNYEVVYCGECVSDVPDTEEELEDWLAFPLPYACYAYDAATGLYRVRGGRM